MIREYRRYVSTRYVSNRYVSTARIVSKSIRFHVSSLYIVLLSTVSPFFGPLAPKYAAGQSPLTGNSQELAAEKPNRRGIEVDKVSAYLAEPFEQLAKSLELRGLNEQAAACRQWIPPQDSDALTAFFSSAPAKAPVAIESDREIAEAFSNARQESAERAFRGAKRCAEENLASLALHLLWRTVRESPNHPQARTLLGLPTGRSANVTTRPGRTAPQVLGWPPRSFLVGQGPHFRIFSTASKQETMQLAEDLERFFEVWSQVFFKHWTSEREICESLLANRPIEPPPVICNVVLFGDRQAYSRALGTNNPASSQSTGYYSPENKLTLLFAGNEADSETRYHEITHQLLQEVVPRVVESPGKDSGFWIVEGIASYIESIQFCESYATIGGWQSPRLQYARARILPAEEVAPLESILPLSREQFQQSENLAELYTTSAAYVHMMFSSESGRAAILRYLDSIYQGRDAPELVSSQFEVITSSKSLIQFLKLEDNKTELLSMPCKSLELICLNRCQVSADRLRTIAEQPRLSWLDLGWLEIKATDVQRIVGNGTLLKRLNLEATHVDDALAPLLAKQRRLEELDLSFTRITDATVQSLQSLESIETLWLTGTNITDECLPTLKSLRNLKNLDVQRTQITAAGLEQLRQSLPSLQLNPLVLQ